MAAAPPPSADGRLFASLERARRQAVAADGASGTLLLPLSRLPAELNLTRPDAVRAVHAAYIAAGAQLLVANTLTATRELLGARAARAAEAGVRLARQGEAMVLGSLAAVPGRSQASYREQIRAMADADGLIVETVTSIAALDEALEAIATSSRLAVVATLSFDAAGRLDGLEPESAAERLAGRVTAFGYGCGHGPDACLAVLPRLRAGAPDAVLIAKPNLGLPPYSIAPAELARWAQRAHTAGADVIGACCGSTAAHIRAISGALAAGSD